MNESTVRYYRNANCNWSLYKVENRKVYYKHVSGEWRVSMVALPHVELRFITMDEGDVMLDLM